MDDSDLGADTSHEDGHIRTKIGIHLEPNVGFDRGWCAVLKRFTARANVRVQLLRGSFLLRVLIDQRFAELLPAVLAHW